MENCMLTYPEILRRFRQRYNHGDILKEIENQLSKEIESLRSVTSCLSIGTGFGEFDIDFIKRCLPNLEKLILVEKDADCCRELKINVDEAFGDKLDVEIHESQIEAFLRKNSNIKVDLILALHVLYFLKPSNRVELLKTSFERWLEPNKGMFIYANPSKENDVAKMYDSLGIKSFQHSELIKEEIENLGLNIVLEKPYRCLFDFRTYDVDLHAMLEACHQGIVTKGMIEEVLKSVSPDGWGSDDCELCVIMKNELN